MQAVSSGRHIRFLQQVRLHEESIPGCIFEIPLHAGKTTVIEKRVRVLLDRETPNIESSDPWQAHTDAWTALWRDCDIEMDTDEFRAQCGGTSFSFCAAMPQMIRMFPLAREA